jgi:glutamate 5-kinase
VDGLYDTDPRRRGARRITHVLSPDDLDGVALGRAGAGAGSGAAVGTGGMVTKVDAAMIATEAGIPTVLASADDVAAALAGEPVGTYFAPDHKRPAARQLWLAHATVGRGRLLLDDGAVAAVRAGHASLLPAGITGLEGSFDAGDPVDLCDASGHVVARGLVNYDAAEIPALMGRSTKWLAAELGPEYEREIVHRDDLVVLRSPRRRRAG